MVDWRLTREDTYGLGAGARDRFQDLESPAVMRLRPLALLAAASAALALGACGNKVAVVKEGKTEGTYLNVGDLQYQVQISRALNPADVEDRDYLVGLPAAARGLKANET